MLSGRYVVFLALLCASSGIAAAETDTIEEISVFATRRTASIAEVSSAVATSELAAVEQKLATDALRDVLGVTLQQTTPGQGAAIVRGLKGSAILHLVDGMRLNNAMFRSAPTPWFALVPTTSVDRIEVIRGTPASLYGSEAVGGVIQSVSRLPELDSDEPALRGNVAVTLDSAELQKAVRATLDAGTNRLAASLSAEYLKTGDRRVGGGKRIGPSGYTSKAVRAVVRGKPTAKRNWFLDLHFLEQPETPRVDELVAGFGQTEPSSSEFAFVPNRRSFAHFQHEHVSARDIDWKVDLAWQRIDDDRRTRDFGAAATRFEDNRSDLYGLSINASGSRAGLDWIAGLDLYHDEVRSARRELDTLTGVTSDLAPRFPDGSIVDQGGAFARIDWQSGERHRLSLGIRYTDVRIELPDGTRIDPGSPSGDLGWIFNLNEELQIVANAGSGFRAPNIADLGTLGNRPGNRFNVPNADLDAESVTHFDVGLRLRRPDWRAVLIAYRLDYDERIISVDTGSKTPEGRDIVRSVNAAESTVHGVEAGLDARIAERVNLVATLNYTYGVQRVADSEEPADRVPPLRARVLGSFRHSDSWVYEAWLDAARGQDRLSDRDIRDVRIDPQGTPGWATLGVRARWTLQQGWQLVGAVDNILDRRYRVHGSGLDAPGRNLSLTIQRSW